MNTDEHTEAFATYGMSDSCHNAKPAELRDFVGVRMPAERPTLSTDAQSVHPWMDPQNMTAHARDLERQLAEAREQHKHTSGNLYEEQQAHGLTKGKLTECQLALAAAIRERDQARADATEWSLNLTTAIRELAEAREKIQGLHDGVDYATNALMREKTLADRLADDIDKIRDNARAIQRIKFGKDRDYESVRLGMFIEEDCDLALTAWKEARRA